jgi:hypothetical protein
VSVLKDFAIRGYVLDKERLKNGSFFNKAYFDGLLEEIREIRASERRFYQKITDIYATAMDYDAKAFAESEFEKYRVVQDHVFESDFNKHVKQALVHHERLIEKENHELSPISKS